MNKFILITYRPKESKEEKTRKSKGPTEAKKEKPDRNEVSECHLIFSL